MAKAEGLDVLISINKGISLYLYIQKIKALNGAYTQAYYGGENRMLSENEILQFIQDDSSSEKKTMAAIGQRYYEGDHDIRNYTLWYYNADGELVEDKTRSNIRIPHPFFTELTDQAVQYMLSGKDGFVKSDIPALQNELDAYFNENEDFTAELYDTITGCFAKGFEYIYAYKNSEGRTAFECADSLGVVEVRAKDTDDATEYVIYHYIDRIEKGKKKIKKIQVWDAQQTYFYVQEQDGKLLLDDSQPINPKPHTIYQKEGDAAIYYEQYGFIPFFRLDNNKKQFSSLKPIKDLIDDYDLMACGLSNNLQDASEYLVVVHNFQGDNLDELMQNIKTKKHIGVDEEGGVDYKTVDIPYEARRVKLELDEKNIYRFGGGLNLSSLKDTSATTNIAIKSAYALLDMRCNKLEIRLKQLMRKLLKVVLAEINEMNGTDYQQKDVYFDFEREVVSNAQENAQIKLTEAQTRQAEITTLLNLASQLDDETLMQLICDELDIDYEEIKGKLPKPEEDDLNNAQDALNGVVTDEQQAKGTIASGTE